jgi:hypothetical protein
LHSGTAEAQKDDENSRNVAKKKQLIKVVGRRGKASGREEGIK